MRFVVAAAVLLGACAHTSSERVLYYRAISAAADALPKGGVACWITPDLRGGAGSNVIAEEVFVDYLAGGGHCRPVEKHVDNAAGWTPVASPAVAPPGDVAPAAPAGPVSAAAGLLARKTVAGTEYDNEHSENLALEHRKKAVVAQKVIVFRIASLGDNWARIQFRVSDAKTGLVEASRTVFIDLEK